MRSRSSLPAGGQETFERGIGQTDACFEPLLALMRGSTIESVHRGAIAVVDDEDRLLGGVGDPRTQVLLRSAAKPFQAAAVVGSGAAESFSLTDQEVAVISGSHRGRPEHVRVVEGMLSRLGIPVSALVCGSTAHQCSGKHAGLLALALHLGAPVEGYEREEHPAQREVARTVLSLIHRHSGGAGTGRLTTEPSPVSSPVSLPTSPLFAGVDGCGVPVLRLSLREAAWLYALLAAGATPALARVRDAMDAHPDLVAGEGSLDTRAMRSASARRLVAKGGRRGYRAWPSFLP